MAATVTMPGTRRRRGTSHCTRRGHERPNVQGERTRLRTEARAARAWRLHDGGTVIMLMLRERALRVPLITLGY